MVVIRLYPFDQAPTPTFGGEGLSDPTKSPSSTGEEGLGTVESSDTRQDFESRVRSGPRRRGEGTEGRCQERRVGSLVRGTKSSVRRVGVSLGTGTGYLDHRHELGPDDDLCGWNP